MQDQSLLKKIQGGLYGQALGDAWAMPALLRPAETWQHFGGWITQFLDAPETHPVHRGLRAGQVTDDTEQAMALAESIIADNGVTVEGVARAICNWYDRIGGDASMYVGPSTRRAVQAIKRGVDLYQTGRFGDTNGASMRVSVVGLVHPGDVDGAVKDAYLSCVPTHNTDVAVSGAAAVAGAVASAMPPDAELEGIIAAGQRAAEMGLMYGTPWMGASIAKRIGIAVEIARSNRSERERLQEMYDVIGAGLAITEAVPCAFGVLVMAEGDPKQTAIYAAGLSGDADTVGAMACAIAGAWKGIEAFEPFIVQQLKAANPALDFDMVAQGLFDLVRRRG